MTHAVEDSTLSTFTASDGANLAVQDWPLAEGLRPRGMVLLVHGLGEHAGRYDHVARRLNQWGFAVRGYDQYGHGESDGVHGTIPTFARLTDDLADIIDSTRARFGRGVPLIVLGHSLGGLVAARLLATAADSADALVLSSPAFDAGFSALQKRLLRLLSRIAPRLTLGNGLDPDFLSHDPDVVAAYRADPRVHNRVSLRLARFIADSGPAVLARTAEWRVPTLLLYAGLDKLVEPAGSRAFAAAAPASVVTARCFRDLFHELFNELQSDAVFEFLRDWLDARF
jgi:alpha-beta hydrolase superfamily lysophospholipase